MASPSPQPLPMMGNTRRLQQRQESMSPAPQEAPQSKKDKKRDAIKSKFTDKQDKFSRERDNFYRIALQTLQIDINLITAADPHNAILTNDPDEIERLVRDCIKSSMMKHFSPEPPPQSGRVYSRFAKACNDAAEERDAALATLHRDVAVKLAQIDSDQEYRKVLAKKEYKALSNSLRDRLINSVTSKKNRLLKDKDMDIGDSTAMLLHPNQYSIANPSSPGGVHGKRATRNRRDAEDAATFPESNKRKRKAQDSDESPAPTRPRVDNGNGSSTPRTYEWHAERKHLMETQIDSPLYSVDKLFTEKELAMTYNAAALAAHSYMLRHSPVANGLDSPVNGSYSSSDNGRAAANEAANDADDVDSPAPGGVMMERGNSHLTRSTRAAAAAVYSSGFGMDSFADNDILPNLQGLMRHMPKLPPVISLAGGGRTLAAKAEIAPVTAGLSAEEAMNEVDLIRKARLHNDSTRPGANLEDDIAMKTLLEEAAKTRRRWIASENYEHLPKAKQLEKEAKKELEASLVGLANGSSSGSQPMSRNNSRRGEVES